MAANACCAVCTCFSTFFCLCREPEKVYLCTNCIPVHMGKGGGGHSLFPSEAAGVVNASNDMKIYNARRELVSELLAKLESFQLKVKSEQQEIPGIINQLYTQQANYLYTASIQANEQLSLIYSNIDTEIEALKAHFQRQLEQRDIQLSESASLFIKCAAHTKWTEKVTVSSINEIKAWLTLPDKPLEKWSLRNILQRWACSGCSECSLLDQKHFSSVSVGQRGPIDPANLEIPGIQAKFESRLEAITETQYWTCEQCQYESSTLIQSCAKCKSSNPNGKISELLLKKSQRKFAEAVKAAYVSSLWECATCGYKYNRDYFIQRKKCQAKKSRVESEIKVQTVVNIEGEEKDWKCRFCCTVNNPQWMRCALCEALKPNSQ